MTESPLSHYPAMLVATVKSVVAIALLSVFATHWLQSGLEKDELTRLAAVAARPGDGPFMTGTLRQVKETRLDPCTGKPR